MERPLISTFTFCSTNEAKVLGNAFIKIDDWCRLYYAPKEERSGFDFCVIQVTQASGFDEPDPFTKPDTQGEVVCRGYGFFDGVRHLYFGAEESDNEGYLYYPNLQKLVRIFTSLWRLEEAYCTEHAG
jgi:hypothetical protein